MMQRRGHIFCRAQKFRVKQLFNLSKANTGYGRLDTAKNL